MEKPLSETSPVISERKKREEGETHAGFCSLPEGTHTSFLLTFHQLEQITQPRLSSRGQELQSSYSEGTGYCHKGR